MVYCTKCGAKNEEDAVVCVKCGASLVTYAPWRKERWRPVEEECFGIPHGGAIVGLVIGILIIIAGLSWLLSQVYDIHFEFEIWPFAVIVFGLLVLIGAVYKLGRRY